MTGNVVAIHTAPAAGATTEWHESVRLDAGRGIVGDRYYDKDPDAQITLVDADMIDTVNAQTGWAVRPEETRRNVVTRGVDLNQWEHGRFRIGEALLEGVELCEPCAVLGRLLADDTRQPADVVRALVHRAGLRARILQGGVVRPGDAVRAESDEARGA